MWLSGIVHQKWWIREEICFSDSLSKRKSNKERKCIVFLIRMNTRFRRYSCSMIRTILLHHIIQFDPIWCDMSTFIRSIKRRDETNIEVWCRKQKKTLLLLTHWILFSWNQYIIYEQFHTARSSIKQIIDKSRMASLDLPSNSITFCKFKHSIDCRIASLCTDYHWQYAYFTHSRNILEEKTTPQKDFSFLFLFLFLPR